MAKQSIIINPEPKLSCACCSSWNRHEPIFEGDISNWGGCSVKGVPNYMRNIYYENGCNIHSNFTEKKKSAKLNECEQLTLF